MILFHWNDHGDVNDTKAAKNEDLVLNMYANVFSGTEGRFSALTFFSFQWLWKHDIVWLMNQNTKTNKTTNEQQVGFFSWAYMKLWLDVSYADVQYMFSADGGD